jgi:hypothetical protein
MYPFWNFWFENGLSIDLLRPDVFRLRIFAFLPLITAVDVTCMEVLNPDIFFFPMGNGMQTVFLNNLEGQYLYIFLFYSYHPIP